MSGFRGAVRPVFESLKPPPPPHHVVHARSVALAVLRLFLSLGDESAQQGSSSFLSVFLCAMLLSPPRSSGLSWLCGPIQSLTERRVIVRCVPKLLARVISFAWVSVSSGAVAEVLLSNGDLWDLLVSHQAPAAR